MKIVSFNGQYRITLPKDLVRDKGWNEETELRFVEDELGRVYLKPIEQSGTQKSSDGGRRSKQRAVRGGAR